MTGIAGKSLRPNRSSEHSEGRDHVAARQADYSLGMSPRLLAATALLGALCACSDDPAPEDRPEAAVPAGEVATPSPPDELVIEAPTRLHTNLSIVETESEAVADRLLEFSDRLRKREFEGLGEWFAEDFVGHAMTGVPVAEERELPLAIEETLHDCAGARAVGREAFVDALEALIGPWRSVDSVLFKVKKADFQRARRAWGKVHLKIHMIGRDEDGALVSVGGRADANVERDGGIYVLSRLALTELHRETRPSPMFVDVAAPAGVAHTWTRFGTEGNQSFHWNGAAAGDVDGDGDFDLFVPSDGRNFLYLAQPDGTYAEAAEARGVARPAEGTGALFADFDRDGDQDLMVAHVGWKPVGPEDSGGERLQLYLNDGEGRFTRAEGPARGPGLDVPFVAYTLTALDIDGDGWLDVHVCGYGRVEVEHNDSWVEATNGSPNGLLRCRGVDGEGRFLGFEDIAEAAGVRGSRWSYAAASADIDEDGDADLFVANDYGSNHLWINSGDGTFEDRAEALGVADRGNGMGASFGDLSGDGRLDLYISNMSSTAGNRILGRLGDDLDPETLALLAKLAAGNSIFIGAGEAGGFERLPAENGGIGASWAWSPALFDVDLDGDLDVFCANGFVTGELPFDT